MPNFRILNRKLHRWGAVAVAVPFLVVLVSGILLQVKKQVPWVQPREIRGVEAAPGVSLAQVMDSIRARPELGIRDWSDIDRVDIRPSKGHLKVIGNSRWEVQMDASTGRVLQVAYRRSDLIEQIHDGSFFHDLAKVYVFLPVAVIVLGLWVTGIYLWWLPYQTRRRRAAQGQGDTGPDALRRL